MENRNQNNQSGKDYQPRFLAPESQKKKHGKTALTVVLCLLAVAILVGGTIFGIKLLKDRRPVEEELTATTEAPEITEAPTETEPPETVPVVTEPPPPLPTKPVEEEYEPDQELLDALAANSEIIGRISYGDVEPQYLVQTNNNSYYLNHNAFGGWDSEGAAFFDCRCSIDPRDTNLMVHGHNMNVANSGYGKSFATLFRFRDKSYLGQYPIFKLETADQVYYYVPYALPQVETCPGMPGYYPIVQWNFPTDDAFYAYTGFFRAGSLYDMPVDVKPSDKLLTFSTCINDGSSATELRLLVCMRQLRPDESVAEMEKLYQVSFGVRPADLLPEVKPTNK